MNSQHDVLWGFLQHSAVDGRKDNLQEGLFVPQILGTPKHTQFLVAFGKTQLKLLILKTSAKL